MQITRFDEWIECLERFGDAAGVYGQLARSYADVPEARTNRLETWALQAENLAAAGEQRSGIQQLRWQACRPRYRSRDTGCFGLVMGKLAERGLQSV